jgi:hypothetical protein
MRPHEIDAMTMGELEMALDDDTEKARGPEGVRPMSALEMAAFAERRRSMTPRQKLDQARRK